MNLKHIFILLVCVCCSCKKEFLEKKPDKALLVPLTLSDFRKLLDNSESIMNFSPMLNVWGTDDIWVQDVSLTSMNPFEQRAYYWAKEIFDPGTSAVDWDNAYKRILYANVVLEGLEKISVTTGNQQEFNAIKGTALFTRALAFYDVAQQFAAPYNSSSAATLPGIPLRLSSDLNVSSNRGTLQGTYTQILNDLGGALPLLPVTSGYLTRPTQTACLSLFARLYLNMQDYPKASDYAAQALAKNNALLDYNDLLPSDKSYKIPPALSGKNPEVIYYSVLNFSPSLTVFDIVLISPELYKSYAEYDLRKQLFFEQVDDAGYQVFRGSYVGSYDIFSGLATDEMYLILAECLARAGQIVPAMDKLNALLAKRYQKGHFMPLAATDAEQVLQTILTERRKELVYRNQRWSDLRRLNQDPRFTVTLHRTVKGIEYTLPPNDPKYTLPLPPAVIQNSNLNQNPR